MNGTHTITSFENTQLFAMPTTNGRGMTTEMVFEKFIPILPKACGRMFEIICVLSKVFTKCI